MSVDTKLPSDSGTAAYSGPLRLTSPLRSSSFDFMFIVGTASLALLLGWLTSVRADLWESVFFVNLWLLGYHHVISTYTRLAMDRESFDQNRFLILGAPVLVIAGTVAVAQLVGPWAVFSTYFYWQWFHYTRQSYGIEQLYWRKAAGDDGGKVRRDPLAWCLIYLVPLWGIVHRSVEQQPRFLDVSIWYLPIEPWMEAVVAVPALAAVAVWLILRVRDLLSGRLRVAHTLYLLSHLVVFTSGYIWISNIDAGWLTLNVWHNAQYILVVWMFNTNRFKGGVDHQHRFLSTISQPRQIATYFAVCLGLTGGLYLAMEGAVNALSLSGLGMAVIIYQTVNFHHYIVDSVIWKLRKPSIRVRMGIAAT